MVIVLCCCSIQCVWIFRIMFASFMPVCVCVRTRGYCVCECVGWVDVCVLQRMIRLLNRVIT